MGKLISSAHQSQHSQADAMPVIWNVLYVIIKMYQWKVGVWDEI